MEDPVAVGFPLPLFQNFHRAGRQEDGSGALFRLGFAHPDAAALAKMDGTADMKPPCFLFEILPLQAADLAPAQSRCQLRVEEIRPHRILLHHSQKPLQLLLRQDLLRGIVDLRDHRSLCWIFHDQPFPNRRIHGLMEHHVDAPYHAVRQGVPPFRVLVYPSVFPEPVVHFLDVCGCDGADFLAAQLGLDVAVGHGLVAVHGAFPYGQGHAVLQPVIHPLPQGHIAFFRQLHIPVGFYLAVEFSHQLFLGLGEDGAENGASIFLMPHHNSPFPSAVRSFANQPVSVRSFLCHRPSLLSVSAQDYHRKAGIAIHHTQQSFLISPLFAGHRHPEKSSFRWFSSPD